jgi:hypothetical protein
MRKVGHDKRLRCRGKGYSMGMTQRKRRVLSLEQPMENEQVTTWISTDRRLLIVHLNLHWPCSRSLGMLTRM